jgi:hypothetical protein
MGCYKDFVDVNQVLQRVVVHVTHAKDHISYNQFKEGVLGRKTSTA